MSFLANSLRAHKVLFAGQINAVGSVTPWRAVPLIVGRAWGFCWLRRPPYKECT